MVTSKHDDARTHSFKSRFNITEVHSVDSTATTKAHARADWGRVLVRKQLYSLPLLPSIQAGRFTSPKGLNNCLVHSPVVIPRRLFAGHTSSSQFKPLHSTLSSTPLWSPFAGGWQCSTFLSYETPAATEGHPYE